LVGPTAAGKTRISLELAENIFEIISADSVQVYRHLDIGSGKPSKEERSAVPHHLIDIVDPDYSFTAGDFCREASRAADGILKKSRIPMFVGGTGLYIDSFFKGLSEIPLVGGSIKDELRHELSEKGLPYLYEELMRCDRDFAGRIHPNDRQRILRGLEVYRGTGKPLSAYFDARGGNESTDTLYVGIAAEKDELERRIHRRVDSMMEAGFADEVRLLREMGFAPTLNSMKSIGYAQLNEYLDGRVSLGEAVALIKAETRKYAKRQMTWFRKNPRIRWHTVFEIEKIRELIYNWFH
jgi:tRNA dimethylallyltransferase